MILERPFGGRCSHCFLNHVSVNLAGHIIRLSATRIRARCNDVPAGADPVWQPSWPIPVHCPILWVTPEQLRHEFPESSDRAPEA